MNWKLLKALAKASGNTKTSLLALAGNAVIPAGSNRMHLWAGIHVSLPCPLEPSDTYRVLDAEKSGDVGEPVFVSREVPLVTEDFMGTGPIPDPEWAISQRIPNEIIRYARKGVSRDATKVALQHINVRVNQDMLKLVSTDGFRVFAAEQVYPFGFLGDPTTICNIPPQVADCLQAGNLDIIGIQTGKDWVRIEATEGVVFKYKKPFINFPAVEKVTPDCSTWNRVSIHCPNALEALKYVKALAGKDDTGLSSTLAVAFRGDRIHFKSVYMGHVASSTFTADHEPNTHILNDEFFRDMLEGEEVQFVYPHTPGLIRVDTQIHAAWTTYGLLMQVAFSKSSGSPKFEPDDFERGDKKFFPRTVKKTRAKKPRMDDSSDILLDALLQSYGEGTPDDHAFNLRTAIRRVLYAAGVVIPSTKKSA